MAHKGLNLSEDLFDLFVKYLCDTFKDLGAAQDIVAEVARECEMLKEEVLDL